MFDLQSLLFRAVLILPPLLLSLTVHEWAHAWMATRLGDDTPSREGRLTLNSLAHIDPIGTLVMPLLGIPFGWAKPVMTNPARFRRGLGMTTGSMYVALAGPFANVALAVLAAAALGLSFRFEAVTGLQAFLEMALRLNVTLALFNLIPWPPLDGSRVVDALLPYRLRPAWEGLRSFGPLLLIPVLMFGGAIIAGPSNYVMSLLRGLVFSLA